MSVDRFEAAVDAMRFVGLGVVDVRDFTVPGHKPYRHAMLDVFSATDETILRLVALVAEYDLHLTVWGTRHVSVCASRELCGDEIERAPTGVIEVA